MAGFGVYSCGELHVSVIQRAPAAHYTAALFAPEYAHLRLELILR